MGINSQYDYWAKFPEKDPRNKTTEAETKPAETTDATKTDAAQTTDATKTEGEQKQEQFDEKESIFLQKAGLIDADGNRVDDAKVNTVKVANAYTEVYELQDEALIEELNNAVLEWAAADGDYLSITWADLEAAETKAGEQVKAQETGDADKAGDAKETDETETEQDVAGARRSQYQGAAADRIQTDENGQDFITSGVWGSGDETFTSTGAILQNVYGVGYGTAEGQAVLQKLHEANPEFFASGDYNLIPANAKLNLVDVSDIIPPKEEEKAEETTDEATTAEAAEEAPAEETTEEAATAETAEDAPTEETTEEAATAETAEEAPAEEVPAEETAETEDAPAEEDTKPAIDITTDVRYMSPEQKEAYYQAQREASADGGAEKTEDTTSAIDITTDVRYMSPEQKEAYYAAQRAETEEKQFKNASDLKRDDYAKLAEYQEQHPPRPLLDGTYPNLVELQDALGGNVVTGSDGQLTFDDINDFKAELDRVAQGGDANKPAETTAQTDTVKPEGFKSEKYDQTKVGNFENSYSHLKITENSYYTSLREAAKTGVDSNNHQLTEAQQNKAQTDLDAFIDKYSEINRTLHSNTGMSDYLSYNGVHLAQDFTTFFEKNNGDVDKAIAEYDTYMKNIVKPLYNRYSSADENDKILDGFDKNSWQSLIYKDTEYYLSTGDTPLNTKMSMGSFSPVGDMQYYVSDNIAGAVSANETKQVYDNWLAMQQEAINMTNADKNENLAGFSAGTQEQVKELLDLYNAKFDVKNGGESDWGTHSILKSSDYKLRQQVEAAIKYYMAGITPSGGSGGINLENLIHDLKS